MSANDPKRTFAAGDAVRVLCPGRGCLNLSDDLLVLDQKECTSSPGGGMSAAPCGSCACAIASGVSRSNLISPASATRYPVNSSWSVRPVAAAHRFCPPMSEPPRISLRAPTVSRNNHALVNDQAFALVKIATLSRSVSPLPTAAWRD